MRSHLQVFTTSAKTSLPSGAWPSKKWINKLSLESTSYVLLSRKLEPSISQYFCVLWDFLRQSLSAVPSTVLTFTGQNTNFAQIDCITLLYSVKSLPIPPRGKKAALSLADKRSMLQPICHMSFLTAHPNTSLVTAESWNPNTVQTAKSPPL